MTASWRFRLRRNGPAVLLGVIGLSSSNRSGKFVLDDTAIGLTSPNDLSLNEDERGDTKDGWDLEWELDNTTGLLLFPFAGKLASEGWECDSTISSFGEPGTTASRSCTFSRDLKLKKLRAKKAKMVRWRLRCRTSRWERFNY